MKRHILSNKLLLFQLHFQSHFKNNNENSLIIIFTFYFIYRNFIICVIFKWCILPPTRKKGALDFKNLKPKKYFCNSNKPNWINSRNLFPIGYNLFCSSEYHSFWEIKILKTVNKLYFVKKWEKVGKFWLICLYLYFICIF
jgi:hypothetical protein